MAFMHNSTVADSEPAWGGVDKTKLPRAAFADQGAPDQKSTWAYPHHWIEHAGGSDARGCYTTGTMLLSRGGLTAAWSAAMGGRSGQKASPAVIAHLRAHRNALGLRSLMGLREPDQSPFARVNARRFAKDVVRTGSWQLPDGRTLDVTRKRMDEWVTKFKGMSAAGIRIPFPVDHSRASTDNQGWVDDLYRDGNRLFAVVEVPLEADAARIGQTIREVSVSVDPNYRDGTGKEWGEVIRHVAPCTEPVVTGQENFVPLEAADGEPLDIIFCELQESKMDWKSRLIKLWNLSLTAEASDEEVLAAAEKAAGGHATALRQAKTERDDAVTQLSKVRQDLADATEKLKAAGKGAPEAPEVVELRKEMDKIVRDAAEARTDQYAADGRITPAMKPIVLELLCARRFNLATKDGESVAQAVQKALDSLPKGAALDLTERVKRFTEIRNPNDSDAKPDEKEMREAGQACAALVQPKKS